MWSRRVPLCATLLSLLFSTSVFAAVVTQDNARIVAQNWIHHLTKENRIGDHARGTRQIAGEEAIFYRNTLVGYNFLLYPSGHIIVPIRDELPPVKLYSDTTTLRMTDDAPVVEWIKDELYKLNHAIDANSAEFAAIDHGKTRNGRLWSAYKADASTFAQAYDAAAPESESLSLGPLLSTTWNQGTPYNMYAPTWYTGESTVTGCVATAAAQIMKYWNYPAAGRGSTSYSWWNGAATTTLSRDFSTSTYNWNLMKSRHTSSDTAAEKDAVARLMSDVGIAFHMDYGPASQGGSGANTMYGVTVFPTYFRYSPTITSAYRSSYASDSAWMQVFRNEVQNGRPSQLRLRDPSAGGHSVVVDGYRDSPLEQIHINLGWGGAYDGWYVSNNIVTGGYSWSDVNYQAAVIGIKPSTPAITSFAASPASPQRAGTPVTISVAAGGGTAPYQYRFWVHDGTSWTMVQDWTNSNTYAWTPGVAGSYLVGVWVRGADVAGDDPVTTASLPYIVTALPSSALDLTAAPASPQVVGTPITLTATATGVTSPTYRFWLWDGSAWSVIRDWGSGTFTWTPGTAGSYQLGVWVKPSSAAGDVWAAYAGLPFAIVPPR